MPGHLGRAAYPWEVVGGLLELKRTPWGPVSSGGVHWSDRGRAIPLTRTCFGCGRRGHICRWCPVLLRRSQDGGGVQEASNGVRAQASLLAGQPWEVGSGNRARQVLRSYADVPSGIDRSAEAPGRSSRVVEAGELLKEYVKRRRSWGRKSVALSLLVARLTKVPSSGGWEIVRVAEKLLLGVGSSAEGVEKAVEAALIILEGAFLGIRWWSSKFGTFPPLPERCFRVGLEGLPIGLCDGEGVIFLDR
ncbi:hypothetical protein Taro_009296 [Colocasia esculenta]|uniref:CCHC-type domain-containing protein n=1 Tax=Colocasia esculenta TaxID=4460 RepID=A0A843U0G2_COLES|nr:hypothetical protein [Colocasia esculenta]